MATTSYVATCALLNELIVACLDEAQIHRTAADSTSGHDTRAHLRHSAVRRATFAKELSAIVRSLGGSPPTGGSAAEGFFAAASRLKGKLFGGKEERGSVASARIEERVDALFERASRVDLPDRARAAIVRQVSELRSDRAALKDLRARS